MNRFDYNFKIIARDAMIRSAQSRLAGASFPSELRLLVMKASVSYHAPTLAISFTSTTADLAGAAATLFDAHPTSAAVHNTLQQTAEQAILETCIFKVERVFNPFDLHTTRGIAPFLETIGARIRHLEIHLNTSSSYQPETTLVKASDSHKTLQRLQRLYPNLKTCSLTFGIRTCFNPVAIHTSPPFLTPSIADRESPFPAGLLEHEFKQDQSIASVLVEIFSVFAEEGPAVRRFVRIMHVQYDEVKQTAVYNYGPLVTARDPKMKAEPQGIRGGAKMVKDAYHLARTRDKFTHAPVEKEAYSYEGNFSRA